MRKVITFLFILFSSMIIYSNTAQDRFINNVFYKFNDIVDTFVLDYAKITGLYTAGGEITGSASIGDFPSFRFGTTVGTIFCQNPFHFMENLDFFEVTWSDVQSSLSKKGLGGAVSFFDNNFLPIPVTYYHFHVGLPKGITLGAKFSVGPIGSFVSSVAPESKEYLSNLTYWSIGGNIKYTIMRDHKYFPGMSVGLGVQYSDTLFDITNIPIGEISLDASNDAIPSKLNFYSHSSNTSIYVDFNISKRIKFFQPFVGFKLVQTITHNLTKIIIDIDLSDTTVEAQDTYTDQIVISNGTGTDSSGAEIGYIIPVTDFIISGGFEFIMKIFRLGIEGSFACASQTGMVTLGMRFQVEDWQFAKIGHTKKQQTRSLK